MDQAIRMRFGLKDTSSVLERVKKIDMAMLFAEKEELFIAPEKWANEEDFEPAKVQIVGMNCTLAESTFLKVFDQISTLPAKRTRPKARQRTSKRQPLTLRNSVGP